MPKAVTEWKLVLDTAFNLSRAGQSEALSFKIPRTLSEF